MVMGSCVYHIAHQGALKAMGNVGRNVEIPKFTEALYDARELAMSRMQAEAEQLKAEGIVGVQLLSLAHKWGGHTTEFFAIGTAVRPLRADHIIAKPQMVLPLTDRCPPRSSRALEAPTPATERAPPSFQLSAAVTRPSSTWWPRRSAPTPPIWTHTTACCRRRCRISCRSAWSKWTVTRHGGMVATVAREVRGVVISRQEISVAEWTQLLAQYLAQLAAESADARLALSKLLGEV